MIIPGLPANAVYGGSTTAEALYGHSLGLFVLTFVLGLVDCMSSVTFLAYLANMPPVYAGALLFGETASGPVSMLLLKVPPRRLTAFLLSTVRLSLLALLFSLQSTRKPVIHAVILYVITYHGTEILVLIRSSLKCRLIGTFINFKIPYICCNCQELQRRFCVFTLQSNAN